MRILHIMSGATLGGAETFFVDLVSALHRAGLEQRVIIRRNPARAAALRQAGIDPIELPFRRFFDLTTRRSIKKHIADFKPDIVQTWMSRASSLCPPGDFIHVGWLGGYYKLKNYPHCQELVGVTRDIRNYVVREGWPAAHAHYLPTLASDEPMPPLRRVDFDTPEKAPLILALGRLHPVKGFDVLLRSLVDIPTAYLWLAGEGPLRDDLQRLTRELGLESRVRFLGWRSDRAALFTTCDLCVMPSRYEPFGTVMIEAWAYHCPIIAAAAAGPRDLIKDGDNGLMVPIDDVAALTKAIRAVADDAALAKRLSTAGRQAYEADFTEAKVVEKYKVFYDELINKGKIHK